MNNLKLKKAVAAAIILILFGGTGSTAYYYWSKYQKTQNLLLNPTEAAQQETKLLVKMLGKIMELPNGEEPTIATVLDKEKLSDQPFFARAQNGDKIVIYTKAMRAILFRPTANRIIDVAPLVAASPSAEQVTIGQ